LNALSRKESKKAIKRKKIILEMKNLFKGGSGF
jgi:hypothetical protein